MKLYRFAVAFLLLIPAGVMAVDYPYAGVGQQSAAFSINTASRTPFNHKLLGLNTNFPENQRLPVRGKGQFMSICYLNATSLSSPTLSLDQRPV